jgi:hypothetical protein
MLLLLLLMMVTPTMMLQMLPSKTQHRCGMEHTPSRLGTATIATSHVSLVSPSKVSSACANIILMAAVADRTGDHAARPSPVQRRRFAVHNHNKNDQVVVKYIIVLLLLIVVAGPLSSSDRRWCHGFGRVVGPPMGRRLPRPMQTCRRIQFTSFMCDSTLPASKDDDIGPAAVVPGTISGVSVSPTGFYVMLQLGTIRKDDDDDDMQNTGNPFVAKKLLPHSYSYVAVPITRSRRDAVAATTPQALTMLQLLAGVDMAGAILPPELLSQLVVVAGKRMAATADAPKEDNNDDPLARYIAVSIRNVLTTSSSSSLSPSRSNSSSNDDDDVRRLEAIIPQRYLDQNVWTRSKIRLPATTLQDVTIRLFGENSGVTAGGVSISAASFVLNCMVEGYGRYQVVLRDDDNDGVDDVVDNRDGTVPTTTTSSTADIEGTWRELLYNGDDAALSGEVVTAAFCALALALRYRAPIRIIVVWDDAIIFDDETTMRLRFPSYQSADSASEPAVRSAEQIARGFTIHTLQAALRLALTKRDVTAATKIRAELDRLDGEGLDRLPVQAETDVDSMQ